MNHIIYAIINYNKWLCIVLSIIDIIAYYLQPNPVPTIVITLCLIAAFIVPLLISKIKKDFSIIIVGNSKVSVCFGDLFEEDCFLVTTNRHFDVVPDDTNIAESSLLGSFVNKFYKDNISELQQTLKECLELDADNNIKAMPYGTTISFKKDEKIIYLLAFTDRNKLGQPKGFYTNSIKGFLKEIAKANHGKTIAIPLLGDNNNLSNTGFANSKASLESLISMINQFGIDNPQIELKIKIVILPNKRSELIGDVLRHSKILDL